jgi:hypothetical protein
MAQASEALVLFPAGEARMACHIEWHFPPRRTVFFFASRKLRGIHVAAGRHLAPVRGTA